MSGRKDYYSEGRRDAEYNDGWDPPHDSILDRALWSKQDVKDREDYREGWSDGGGSSK